MRAGDSCPYHRCSPTPGPSKPGGQHLSCPLAGTHCPALAAKQYRGVALLYCQDAGRVGPPDLPPFIPVQREVPGDALLPPVPFAHLAFFI